MKKRKEYTLKLTKREIQIINNLTGAYLQMCKIEKSDLSIFREIYKYVSRVYEKSKEALDK